MSCRTAQDSSATSRRTQDSLVLAQTGVYLEKCAVYTASLQGARRKPRKRLGGMPGGVRRKETAAAGRDVRGPPPYG
jgi:hypothetical protein